MTEWLRILIIILSSLCFFIAFLALIGMILCIKTDGNLERHLRTIRIHRKYVRKACFRLGIPWRGLVHDLSKYSITELKICMYYTGHGSPHEEARRRLGYSPSWLHHYHKNKHHWEYWLDFSEDGKPFGIKMPYKDVIETLADFIGAGKAYNNPDYWKPTYPLDYWALHCAGKRIMNKESENLFVFLLNRLASYETEDEFYAWYKTNKKKIMQCYEDGGYKD